ncbi:MAG TPA: hypothetical protein DD640_00195, partial [Clostridiales bacterium]|nr:hypothetical protein [Clostridiales bacterium]
MRKKSPALLSVLLLVTFLLTLVILPGCQGQGEKKTPLVIYNWGEYMAREEDTITLYGKEYPIADVISEFETAYPQYQVTYLTYDDNEKMYPKLETESYDIIVPSDYMVVRLITEDKLFPLDMAQLPNVTQYLDAGLKSLQFDADEAISNKVFEYAVPYMFCTVGLIYNQEELGKLTSTKAEDVWGILFDERYADRVGM